MAAYCAANASSDSAKVVNLHTSRQSVKAWTFWKIIDQLALALPRQRIGHGGRAEHVADDFGGRGVAAQVAGAAIAGGVAEAHALDAARIVGRDALALDGHGEFGMAEVLGGRVRRRRPGYCRCLRGRRSCGPSRPCRRCRPTSGRRRRWSSPSRWLPSRWTADGRSRSRPCRSRCTGRSSWRRC